MWLLLLIGPFHFVDGILGMCDGDCVYVFVSVSVCVSLCMSTSKEYFLSLLGTRSFLEEISSYLPSNFCW